jgi:hypothetical protein
VFNWRLVAMPLRRSARVEGAASRQERAPAATIADLPHAIFLLIFALLPVDARLRCAEVCRAWRACCLERSLWTRLDFSPASGVLCRRDTAELMFHTAVGRCGFGHLRALDVSRFFALSEALLTVVVRLNAGALHELCICHGLDIPKDDDWLLNGENVATLLHAAPQLRSLEADVPFLRDVDEAACMLRRAPPFAALHLRGLRFQFAPNADVASLTALATAVSECATITDVFLEEAPLRAPAALAAVVDAALVRRLTTLTLVNASLSPASVPALVRLLHEGGALRTLTILNGQRLLLDAPAATLLADALRANSTITMLSFNGCDLWRNMDAARTLLAALTGHASIQALRLTCNEVHDGLGVTVGQALGSVLAASSALRELNVLQMITRMLMPLQQGLGDAGMARLLTGLARNTQLRRLDVSRNRISEAFADEVLLPAAQAHPALRQLVAVEETFDASVEYEFGQQ